MKKNLLFLTAFFLIMGMAFTACNNTDEPDDPNKEEVGNAEKLPYTETFATSIGKFTEYSVTGEQKWSYDARGEYMKMTGHVGNTEKHENEDWLISPKIDLTGVTAAKLTFDYNCSFFKDLTRETTIWVSEDYTDGAPDTATWQQLTVNLKSVGTWDIIPSDEISLTAYAGKVITIAFKYTSTNTDAGTWEIKNFKVQEGEAAAPTTPGGEATDPAGSGTEETPYNIAAAMANQDVFAWVEGYIVGNVDGEGKSIKTESKFDAPYTVATNFLIADSPDETNYANCLPVQLPKGAIRDGLNLVENAANDGKKVKLYGSLEAYFGEPGLKSVSYYELEGGKTGGTKPVDASGALLSETFAENQGAFTIFDKQIPEGGTYVWRWDTYKYMKASAFIDGSARASESWLISPAIDLSKVTTAALVFDHTGKFFTANKLTEQEVYVSKDYSGSGDPTSATWTKLTIPTWPSGSDWTFVSSGNIELTGMAGNAKVFLAFKYVSTTAGAATWEIKNVVVK